MTQFSTARKEVWLTIDDGPHLETTPEFLDVLEHFDAKATFFVIGRHVDSHRALCREILRRGHGIGNHSATHPAASWWALPPSQVRREILSASDSILAATGQRPRFFRPPVGMCSSGVHAVAGETGLKIIGWSASGLDGCPRPPSSVVKSLLPQIYPGAIVLLHEGERARQRILTLTLLLKSLQQEGYRCVIPEPATLT